MKPLDGYMHALPVAVLIILLISIVGGCRHTPDARLAVAEALMDERPDSALSILDSVDPAALRGDADRALYAMLLTMAQDKCDLDPTNDTLISAAVNYYRTHNDPRRAAISYYYQGRVYYLRDSLPAALMSFQRAKDIAERNKHYFWAGMACRGLADIYLDLENYGPQLTYARKEMIYMRKSGHQPHLDFALIDYANALHNNFKVDSAVILLDQAIDSAKVKGDPALYYRAQRVKSWSLIYQNKYREAYDILQEVSDAGEAEVTDSLNIAWCVALLGDTLKAIGMFDSLREDGIRPLKSSLLADYYQSIGDYRKANIEINRMDSMINKSWYSSVSHTMNDNLEAFYEVTRQLDEFRLRESRVRFWLVIAISIILFGLICYVGVSLYRRKQRQMELKLALAEQMRQTLLSEHQDTLTTLTRDLASAQEETRRSQSEVSELQKTLQDTGYERDRYSGLVRAMHIAEISMLGDLGRIINGEGNRPEIANRKITEVIGRFVQSCTGDNEKISLLEEYANRMHGNIMRDFRAEVPGVTENDCRLFLYSVFDLSLLAVTMMMGETRLERIYNRRSRIRKKVSQLTKEKAERYLAYLNQN